MAGNLTRIILIGKLTRPQEGNRLSTDNDSLFIYKFHSELSQGEEFLMKLVTNLRGNLIRNCYRRSDRQSRECKTIAVISSFVVLYPRKVWRNGRQCHMKLDVDGERRRRGNALFEVFVLQAVVKLCGNLCRNEERWAIVV